MLKVTKVTASVSQARSFTAKLETVTQIIKKFSVLMEQKDSLTCSLFPFLVHLIPVYTFAPFISETIFNIILLSELRSLKEFLSVWFSDYSCISHLPHACYMPCPSHLHRITQIISDEDSTMRELAMCVVLQRSVQELVSPTVTIDKTSNWLSHYDVSLH
jgi:hypothetical protein